MIIAALTPPPAKAERFQRKNERFIPERSGCYVLSTFENAVLYVGLASNLRRRMNQHLDSQEKTGLTELGRAAWFHWIEGDEIHQIERTWLNIHMTHEGRMPVLNKVFSPISM